MELNEYTTHVMKMNNNKQRKTNKKKIIDFDEYDANRWNDWMESIFFSFLLRCVHGATETTI